MWKRFNSQPWPARVALRYLMAVFLLGFCIANYLLWHETKTWHLSSLQDPFGYIDRHPIKKLMTGAYKAHQGILAGRSYNISSAAARYRTRRGRHPPPGFDKWMEAALRSDAIVVEDFFDRIYKDLVPFWSLDTDTIKRRANSWPWVVKVRNGTAFGDGDTTGRVPWLQLWTDLVKEFARHLPAVDMPINYMDEPRLLVPFEDIAKLVKEEQRKRRMPEAGIVTTKFKGLAKYDSENASAYEPEWHNPTEGMWELSRVACGPGSPARNVPQMSNLSAPVEFPKKWLSRYTYHGFIQNWTAAMDPCQQPHLRGLHGTFVEPLSLRATTELIPLFGGSKLPINNEILIPGAMYLTEDEFYSGGASHGPSWHRKKDGIIWRGDASGGRAKPDTWHRFQRHRLVQMLNATALSALGGHGNLTRTFDMTATSIYESSFQNRKQLRQWISGFADVGFVHLGCEPGECGHYEPYYHELPPKPMKAQYNYKFLPDADGNSFSARFRGFLRSTSVPLKATVYAEWHDDRLMPWLHFVPLDNTFRDLYAILEYFAKNGRTGDASARYIADSGRAWAEKVLRREDMRLYVWRLLLEWARVCDENRHTLGYVDDLIKNSGLEHAMMS